ncbi:MAG: PQ loop repeat-domain-containing protein [Benjaminiella poitrasii]|nr:MAG: PQ loop repeat-domain-containing protein [Benjaminiella poitrasii]
MDHSLASSIAGYLSILCWLIVFTPQLWENYRRKSGDGLSMTFLVIWLAGDVFNLIGVIMQGLLVTMFVLALYYTIADMGLIWQVIYYKQQKIKMLSIDQASEEEEEISLISEEPTTSYSTTTSSFISSQENRTQMFNILSGLSIILVTVVSCYTYYTVHHDSAAGHLEWFPQLMGWASAVLYVGSRIPQIVKNWRNKSTEGLSFGMFLCAVMGNCLFTLSIFLKSTSPSYILMNLSWIVGSCGTLVFDFIIFIQFFFYEKDKPGK